jgi:hypothetical protein
VKVAASNQSVILASQYRGAGAKSSSVFDAALGPAATRVLPRPLTIVASSASPLSTAADDASLDAASADTLAPGIVPQQVEPVSHALIGTAQPASRRATTAAALGRRPVELYAQTQGILDATSARSVFLDVHA